MKMNLDDPNLTAYALGELSQGERKAIEDAIADAPEAQAYVRETQQLAGLLRKEYGAELAGAAKPLNIMPLPAPRSFWSDARWLSIGIAAVLAVCAVVTAVVLSENRRSQEHYLTQQTKAKSDVQIEFEPASPPAEATPPLIAQNQYDSILEKKSSSIQPIARPAPATAFRDESLQRDGLPQQPGFNTAEYDHYDENPFLPAATNPLSTFSVDVDTASYANVRRFITSGTRPPKDAVRIEEMLNYFVYDYPQAEGGKPFSITLDATECPWQPEHRLVRIGLKGREVAAEQRGASNLVFLLDVSGSMEPRERLPLVKQAMRLLVDRLTENDRVAIVVYAGASGVALPSTRGDRKEEIVRALEELKAGGSTNGAEGINLAYRIAQENFIKGGVNRVILATDGDFNVGVTSQGELVRLAEEKAQSGVFLTVLGVGNDNLKDSTMQKLADKGNGNYAYLDSLDEARKVLVQQMNGTLVTIAKDVKVQVEFNPARVASYRLLGYEKRTLRKEDFNNDKVDAGEIGAAHTVTALYEVVPAGSAANPVASAPAVDPLKYGSSQSIQPNESFEMLTVKLRYKEPEGEKSELLERAFADNGAPFSNSPADLKFAAAVAEFGMILRDSPHKGNGSLGAVLEWAQEGKGRDEAGYRAGFIELVRKAQALVL